MLVGIVVRLTTTRRDEIEMTNAIKFVFYFALGGLCSLTAAALFFIVLMILNGGL